jgi:hypothetical protein
MVDKRIGRLLTGVLKSQRAEARRQKDKERLDQNERATKSVVLIRPMSDKPFNLFDEGTP